MPKNFLGIRRDKVNSAIAIILLSTITLTLVALPFAYGHTPKWTIQPYLNIHVAPNPVGVGQQLYIVMFTTWALPGADYYNDVRFRDFKLTITKPNGTTEVKDYPIVTDSGGSIFFLYTPTEVGIYTLLLESPEQTYVWNQANTPAEGVYAGLPASAAIYENDTILAATKTVTFTVQEEPIGKLDDIPLPTEYWSRPIEAQNFQWGSISSNWLAGAAVDDRWQKDGSAPRTPHVMWNRPLELGGLVGGTQAQDATYYEGFSYETRFNNPIVISGILIYELPLSNAGGGGGTIAVDLRTGEQIWYSPTVAISKGQIFSFQQTPNQHGAVAPLLWEVSGSTWRAYDALTGKGIFNLTNVPNGVEKYVTGYPFDQNNGMIVRYVFSYNTTARSGSLALWNNTLPVLSTEQVFSSPGWRPVGKGNIPANAPITPAPVGTTNIYWNGSAWVSNAVRMAQGYPAVTGPAYSWNVTISADLVGDQNPSIVDIIPDDVILGRSSDVALASNWHPMSGPWTIWALNLNASKGPIGQLLWKKSHPAPSGNQTIMFGHLPLDPVNRVFLMTDRETGQRRGYSLDTGDLLWGPVGEEREIQYYSARQGFPANGTLYVSGYGGEVFAYSTKDGTLLWKYNNTDSGVNTPWGLYPIHASAVAGGIVYTFPGEHSPNKPLYKGQRIRAIDATTGEEVWTLMGWSASGLGTTLAPIAIADGFMAYRNVYDGLVYSLGKGPSATTVTASPKVSAAGSSVLVEGTVRDTATGTKQKEQIARFPNGVAAVSDESMSSWMEYIYMQKPRPFNAKGVEVILSVLDSNNNFREIGRTTSDSDGFYSFQWKPDITGKYTVYASFAGSEAYYPSHAEAAFVVDPAPAEPPEVTIPPDNSGLYVTYGTIAIIITIIIVGAVIILMQRRRP